MSLFHNLLTELSNKIKGKEFYKDSISKEISDALGISIKPDQLVIKNNQVFLNVSPTIKTVIKLKKDVLLKKIGKFNITNIS